jgi:hypothetical protein
VANIIPTELKTTKKYGPSEIKLVENNEIPTELKTTKNCEPSEIKLVENLYQFYFRWLTVLSSF